MPHGIINVTFVWKMWAQVVKSGLFTTGLASTLTWLKPLLWAFLMHLVPSEAHTNGQQWMSWAGAHRLALC